MGGIPLRWLSLHIRDALAISDFTEGIDYPCGGVYVQPTQSFSIQWGPRASVSARGIYRLERSQTEGDASLAVHSLQDGSAYDKNI